MDPSIIFTFAIFIALGVFSIIAAAFNIEWYFQTSGAATFIRMFGRKGARVFYLLLGITLVICGSVGILYYL